MGKTSQKGSKDEGRSNRVVVYLSDDQRAAIDERSQQTGAPMSEILRRAITFYLDAVKKGGAR